MIDIHTHILPLIDDGSDDCNHSIEMIINEIKAGVNEVVFTPHYRFDYQPTKAQVLAAFNSFNELLKERGIEIKTYLGQELFIDRNFKTVLSGQDLLTINGGKYILVEFDLEFEYDILSTVYELSRLGYVPIVAHLERYYYADIELAYQVKCVGGLIQLNAESIIGQENRRYKKFVKQLFKNDLVDFVASDLHCFRENLMQKSYQYVQKKFGKSVADKVFTENAKMMLNG